jgi:hypothetical protein
MWRRRLASLLTAVVLLCASRSAAQDTSEPCDCDDAYVTTRLQRIEQAFVQEQLHARLWWYGWMSYTLVEGAVGVLKYVRSESNRFDRDLWAVSWVGSYAFAMELAIFPLVPVYARPRLARMPRNTPQERRQALAYAEKLMARSAAIEHEGRSWTAHLAIGVWSAGTTAFLIGRNYEFGVPATTPHNRHVLYATSLELAFTVAVAELVIWTQPIASVRHAAELGPSLCGREKKTATRGKSQLSVAAGMNQALLKLSF